MIAPWSILCRSFSFSNHGRLVDGDLELVPPSSRLIDEKLRGRRHPMTIQSAPSMSRVTRQSLSEFVDAAPGGHFRGGYGRVPSYHFWMKVDHPGVPVRIAGGIGLRVGDTDDLRFFVGNIGYNVFPPARGHHYAERACRLLFPLARFHRMKTLWITANPDNAASLRTLHRLGGTLVDTVDIPRGHELRSQGDTQKCRFRFEL